MLVCYVYPSLITQWIFGIQNLRFSGSHELGLLSAIIPPCNLGKVVPIKTYPDLDAKFNY